MCHLPYNGVTMYLHCISVQTIFFTKHIFLKSWRLCIYMISRKYAEWAKKMTMKLNIRLKNDLRKWIHMFIWLYIDPHMFIWLYIYWSMTFKVNYWGETRELIFYFFYFLPLFTKNVSAVIYCKIIPIIPKKLKFFCSLLSYFMAVLICDYFHVTFQVYGHGHVF